MKSKLVLILSFLIITTVGAFLWWAFSPLLFDTEVQDELSPTLKAKLEVTDQEVQVDDVEVISEGPFSITGTTGHPARGEVEIIHSSEETLLYYTNYEGTNGPDLYIYLAKDLEARDYVDLGPQRGNKGNIVYNIPRGVDLREYKYILTWCKAFGVLFDYAEIK